MDPDILIVPIVLPETIIILVHSFTIRTHAQIYVPYLGYCNSFERGVLFRCQPFFISNFLDHVYGSNLQLPQTLCMYL